MLNVSKDGIREGQEMWRCPHQGWKVVLSHRRPGLSMCVPICSFPEGCSCPWDASQASSLHPLSIALGLPVLLGSWFRWQLLFLWVCVSSPVPPGLCCQKEKGKESFSGGYHPWRSTCLQVPLGLGWLKLSLLQGKEIPAVNLCQEPRATSASAASAWTWQGEVSEGQVGCV